MRWAPPPCSPTAPRPARAAPAAPTALIAPLALLHRLPNAIVLRRGATATDVLFGPVTGGGEYALYLQPRASDLTHASWRLSYAPPAVGSAPLAPRCMPWALPATLEARTAADLARAQRLLQRTERRARAGKRGRGARRGGGEKWRWSEPLLGAHTAAARRQAVVRAVAHAWRGYAASAMGRDELTPLRC